MRKPVIKIPRREQILSALEKKLEENLGERITTAILANAVGVSEAALYRHFPSKTKMFEGLVEFIEDSFFTGITKVLSEEESMIKRCELMVNILLQFAEKHPGLSRLLIGEALTGETARLQERIVQLFERIEHQFEKILSEAELNSHIQIFLPATQFSRFLLIYINGAIVQYIRSEFKTSPSEDWLEYWNIVAPRILIANSSEKS